MVVAVVEELCPAPSVPDIEDAEELRLNTAPPEFYDPDADDRDERWVAKQRKGHKSDAVLSCPLCFTTLCVDCQQHARYENQFRAMFVMNCRCGVCSTSRITWLSVGCRMWQRPVLLHTIPMFSATLVHKQSASSK